MAKLKRKQKGKAAVPDGEDGLLRSALDSQLAGIRDSESRLRQVRTRCLQLRKSKTLTPQRVTDFILSVSRIVGIEA